MQRLVINNHYKIENIVEKSETFLDHLINAFSQPEQVRHLSLSIQHPNRAEEVLHFATQNGHRNVGNSKVTFTYLSESEYRDIRATKVQEIVNRLEADGYSVSTTQLALFMDYRITRLIMEKR